MFCRCAIICHLFSDPRGCICDGDIFAIAGPFIWEYRVADSDTVSYQKRGLGGDLINFVLCVIAFGVVTYFLANFLIKNSTLLHRDVTEITTMTVKETVVSNSGTRNSRSASGPDHSFAGRKRKYQRCRCLYDSVTRKCK